jgi:hypothetical protein
MATAIFTLGTPHAAWEPLARAVGANGGTELGAWLDRILGNDPSQWALLAADEERWKNSHGELPPSGTDSRLCWALEALDKQYPQAKYLIFADTPVRALAYWIASSGPGGVEQALDLWCAGAQRLLRHAHRHPHRVLMVASDEVAATPQALGGPLRERLGLALGKVQGVPSDDPLAIALASAIVAGRPAVLGLYEELLATCLPLAEAAGPVNRGAVTWREDVVRLYREAQQANDEARRALERERANACEVLLRLHGAEETIESQTVAERERSAQLARVQGRESHLRNELALAVSGREQQLGELRKKLRLQEEKLAQATTRLAEHTKQARSREEVMQREIAAKAAAERDLATARQQLTKAQAAEKAREDESLVLQKQVLQLQEQLRGHHAQVLQLQEQLRSHQLNVPRLEQELRDHQVELEKIRRGGVLSAMSYDAVTFGTVLDQPPHRHVDAHVHGLKRPGRVQEKMAVRLVEHQGRPGLALFEDEGLKPISGWQTSGQEGARSFMLLIPQDAASARALGMLGSADWTLVTGIVQMLEAELGNNPFAAAPYWHSVATRLRLLLAELPSRLRYDLAALSSEPQPADRPAIDVHLNGALYGSRRLGDLRLRWLLDGSSAGQPPLRWLLAAGSARIPAIAHWPLEENGQAASELIIPVGPGLDAASKRASWSAFSAQEQGVLLGVLDALPACAAAAGAELLPPGWDARRLAAAAQELRDDGHRTCRSIRARQLARRVLRRAS